MRALPRKNYSPELRDSGALGMAAWILELIMADYQSIPRESDSMPGDRKG